MLPYLLYWKSLGWVVFKHPWKEGKKVQVWSQMLSAKLKTGSIKLYPSLPPPSRNSDWCVQSSWQLREPLPPGRICCVSHRKLSTKSRLHCWLPDQVCSSVSPPAKWIWPFPPSHCRDRGLYSPGSYVQACLQAKNIKTLHFTDNAIELSPWKSQSLKHSIYPVAQHPRNSSLVKFYSGSTAGENRQKKIILLSILLP